MPVTVVMTMVPLRVTLALAWISPLTERLPESSRLLPMARPGAAPPPTQVAVIWLEAGEGGHWTTETILTASKPESTQVTDYA
jgi:hypothetical protein